jgi:hypothetical protein
MRISRRTFLRTTGGAAALPLFGLSRLAASALGPDLLQEDADAERFASVMTLAEKENLHTLPLGDVIARLGRHFLGTPYVAHTLEAAGEEHLIVNLREFDCTTFMENMLVLARCVVAGRRTFAEYREELTFVRYRKGTLDGYPSRLHYFTDWVFDNEEKKVLRNVSLALGGTVSRKKINFMSTHPASYPQLAGGKGVDRIAAAEAAMSARGFAYVPRAEVPKTLGKLQNGDLIGTVTDMEGMDVAHTGLIVLETGVPRFLHAPLSGKKVLLAGGSLGDYVGGLRSVAGVVVARPLPPPEQNGEGK